MPRRRGPPGHSVLRGPFQTRQGCGTVSAPCRHEGRDPAPGVLVTAAGLAAQDLASAIHETREQAAEDLYRVIARPLLPDESGCPGS